MALLQGTGQFCLLFYINYEECSCSNSDRRESFPVIIDNSKLCNLSLIIDVHVAVSFPGCSHYEPSFSPPVYLQVQLPGYLKSLPLPKSIGDFVDLTRQEWLELLPFFLFLTILLYLLVAPFLNLVTKRKQPRPRINRKLKLSEPKIADTFDLEDLGDKASFCRCWRSNTVSDQCLL